jgi:hypothetical protein
MSILTHTRILGWSLLFAMALSAIVSLVWFDTSFPKPVLETPITVYTPTDIYYLYPSIDSIGSESGIIKYKAYVHTQFLGAVETLTARDADTLHTCTDLSHKTCDSSCTCDGMSCSPSNPKP